MCSCNNCTKATLPALTHRRNIMEELVGVTQACHREDGRAGRQCPSHEMGILHSHVGTEHPSIAGQGSRRKLSLSTWCQSQSWPAPPTPYLQFSRERTHTNSGDQEEGSAQDPTFRQRQWRECAGPPASASGPAAAPQNRPAPALWSTAQCAHAAWTACQMGATFRSNAVEDRKLVRSVHRPSPAPALVPSPLPPHSPRGPTCSAKTTRASCCAASSRMKPELLAKDHTSPSLPV